MINFFRRIRQKLLTEGRLSKYLIYAIGEIALVMIGILLALQVNNWNESRKDKDQEKIILTTVLSDLSRNQDLINQSRKSHIKFKRGTDQLIGLMGDNFTTNGNQKLIDSLMFWVPIYEVIDFELSNEKVANENSAIQLIQNVGVRDLIKDYPQYVSIYKDIEIEIRRMVIERVRQRIEALASLGKIYNGSTAFENDSSALMQDRIFYNILIGRIFIINDLLESLDNLEKLTVDLKEAILAELDNRF